MKSNVAAAIGLKIAGKRYSEIGQILGFKRQFAQELVRPPIGTRVLLRKRANDCCERCLAPESNKTRHHIHHKQSVGKTIHNFNSLDNLEYLCASCHKRTDNPAKPKPEKKPKDHCRNGHPIALNGKPCKTCRTASHNRWVQSHKEHWNAYKNDWAKKNRSPVE